MAKSRVAKKIDKLEKETDKLRKKAEKRGKGMKAATSDRIDELTAEQDKGGKKGLFALILAALAGAGFALKKKRDQELDEALWEEPRSI